MEFVNIQMLSCMEQQAVGFGGHVGIAEPHQPPHLDAFAGQNACHGPGGTAGIFQRLPQIQKAAAPKRQTAAAMQITDWCFFRYSFIGFSFPFSSKINLASFRLVYLVWSVCCFGAGNSLQYSGYLTLMPSMK